LVVFSSILFLLAAACLQAGDLPVPASGAAGSGDVLLTAVGDIRLDGFIGNLASRHKPSYPVELVADVLRKSDILYGNLECPVTLGGRKLAKTWNFRAKPAGLKVLKAAGFQLVGLANNHVMDYGIPGLLDTLRYLKKANILAVGAGENEQQAAAMRILDKSGLKIGFLAFTSTLPREIWAKKNRPGVSYSNFQKAPHLIRKAKKRCDLLVVLFHGGEELADEPNAVQKSFAKLAVESGADLFIGHHPHVVQPVEIYKGKPILYSLGNFLFLSPDPKTQDTIIAECLLQKEGVKTLTLHLVDLSRGRPRLLTDAARSMPLVQKLIGRLPKGCFKIYPAQSSLEIQIPK